MEQAATPETARPVAKGIRGVKSPEWNNCTPDAGSVGTVGADAGIRLD